MVPGIRTQLESLHRNCAQLPNVSLIMRTYMVLVLRHKQSKLVNNEAWIINGTVLNLHAVQLKAMLKTLCKMVMFCSSV